MAEQIQSAPQTRLGGFDLVRVFAAVGVVLLHACAPYMEHPLPGLTWSVFDTPSRATDVLGWSIELFIMPLFLLIAGYFTPPVMDKLGTWAFIKHRFQRLIVPLVVAMFLILPADLYIWLTGWVTDGLIPLRKLRSLKFENGIDEDLWGLSHLWFLQYLFLYAVCYVLLARSSLAEKLFGRMKAWQQLGSLAFAGWCVLFCVPKVVFGFQHDFLPVPSKWFYSGAYFVGGVLLARNAAIQQFIEQKWRPIVLIGAAATLLGVNLGVRMLEAESNIGLRIGAVTCTVVSAWLVSLGAVVWAGCSRVKSTRALRYLAAASFWVYLVHHPIIGLCHIQLKVLVPNCPSEIKMLVATATALLFSLLSFEALIRRWPLANLLGTPREFCKTTGANLHLASRHSSGGTQSCPGVSSTGHSPRHWPASSSVSTPS